MSMYFSKTCLLTGLVVSSVETSEFSCLESYRDSKTQQPCLRPAVSSPLKLLPFLELLTWLRDTGGRVDGTEVGKVRWLGEVGRRGENRNQKTWQTSQQGSVLLVG